MSIIEYPHAHTSLLSAQLLVARNIDKKGHQVSLWFYTQRDNIYLNLSLQTDILTGWGKNIEIVWLENNFVGNCAGMHNLDELHKKTLCFNHWTTSHCKVLNGSFVLKECAYFLEQITDFLIALFEGLKIFGQTFCLQHEKVCIVNRYILFKVYLLTGLSWIEQYCASLYESYIPAPVHAVRIPVEHTSNTNLKVTKWNKQIMLRINRTFYDFFRNWVCI